MPEERGAETRFDRTRMVIGEEGLEILQKSRVLLFGLGGVGGYAAEALARVGVGNLDLVDMDTVDVTNLNRQIVALRSTIGRRKVDVMAERICEIAPDVSVRTYPVFFRAGEEERIPFQEASYVIDAVDTVAAKLAVVQEARRAGVPVISVLGTGNKWDISRLRVTDIRKTDTDPLARVMRRKLRELGIPHLKVVFSDEIPVRTGQRTPGSLPFVPGAAGLMAAGEAVRDLLDRKNTAKQKEWKR